MSPLSFTVGYAGLCTASSKRLRKHRRTQTVFAKNGENTIMTNRQGNLESVYEDELLKKYMPRGEKSLDGDRLACETFISEEMLFHAHIDMDNYIQRMWQIMYEKAVREVTAIIMGRTEHFLCRYIPKVYSNMGAYTATPGLTLRVIYEIMVCQTSNIVIPTFVYPEASRQPVEWRCGYCTSPNQIHDRHCTQCGAPRALLIQEI